MLNVFITGLEKQSGKTIVAAGLAGTMQSLCYSTSVYKPIQTGANSYKEFLEFEDLSLIKQIDPNIKTFGTYIYESPLTPLVAAYTSGSKIDITSIYNDFQSNIQMTECHIVEGANCISSPIDEKRTEIDIVKALGLPLLLVLNPKKSSIDDVILGVNYIRSLKVNFQGVIITDFDDNSNNLEEKYFPQLVKEYTNVNILGLIPHYEDIEFLTPDTLIADILNRVNIEEIFGLKIAKLNS